MKQIVVIGGGPAGVAAATAVPLSATVTITLITNSPLGGRAGWHSLIPSKVWLMAAAGQPTTAPADLLPRIQQVAQSWQQTQLDTLQRQGVQVVSGTAVFHDADTLHIYDEHGRFFTDQAADAVIVASGSVPTFPEALKPDGRQVIAPRLMSRLSRLPASIIVVGGGATGSEFAYLFQQLGVAVTWVVDAYGVLPQFQAAAGHFLADTLSRRGVKLVPNQTVLQVEKSAEGVVLVTDTGDRYAAEMAFMAIGRQADLAGLHLERAGVAPQHGRYQTDAYGRTINPAIYLVGDAAGAPMLANRATAQAWVAGRHAAGVETGPFVPEAVVGAVYTDPEVAQVGQMGGDEGTAVIRLPFSASLKAHLLPQVDGFIELVYRQSDTQLVGGLAVGPHAADLLTPVALAIQQHLPLAALAAIHPAHPTLSELPFLAARAALAA